MFQHSSVHYHSEFISHQPPLRHPVQLIILFGHKRHHQPSNSLLTPLAHTSTPILVVPSIYHTYANVREYAYIFELTYPYPARCGIIFIIRTIYTICARARQHDANHLITRHSAGQYSIINTHNTHTALRHTIDARIPSQHQQQSSSSVCVRAREHL